MNFRFLPFALLAFLPAAAGAQTFIAEDGQPRAEIVIADDASRTTRLAAAELQTTVEKMSGAKLPIVAKPGDSVSIYVGESEHTRKLGVTAKGLEHGAYRMTSGENWLALVGDDTEFVPKEPWATNNGGRQKLQARWEEASGLPYGVPNGGMYKNRKRMPEELAKEDGENFWGFDERGSYNAVCGFLRSLGVRWYLPGELGEVIPDMPTIPLPKVDETVKPDFEIRQFSARIGNCDDEVTRWIMRLGTRNVSGLMIAHGMHTMTHPDKLKTDKPDWFALYGGKRDTQTGKRLNHLCYSNADLFTETVRWARAQFDVYDSESVSIMPPDAYGSICQCDLCEGKQIDEMGARGKLSNHVWDFANRVAKEVAKTHPDKLIACCAYGANTEPPTNIDKLEPNVQVVIVGGRRPRNSLPEQREYVDNLRAGWLKLTDQPIVIFENYPFTGRGVYLPAFVARTNAQSINATKGLFRGEDIWLSFPRSHDDPNIGFDHFQVYFTARMYWGGKDADVVAMLEEYCNSFYGPAGPKMMEFFDYCEANYQAMEDELEPAETALAMLEEAKSSVAPDSVHAKRLALIDDFLNALRSKAEQLGQGRGPVAKMRTVLGPRDPIVIDGKLDDEYWVRHRDWSVTPLRELQTGGQPIFGTTVMAGWDRGGQNVYFAIRCEERPGEKLNITATKHDDEAIWYGDVVEILLDTDSHSYYQIAINPAGALADLDRGVDKSARFRWESQAEVATHVAEDHWIVEIRIPVTEDENDPLNQVIGRKPSQSLPWHFNICRQRARENGTELSAVSPTGAAGFHHPLKFGHFHDGGSHAFDVDETVTDFLIEFSAAAKLKNSRKYDEAMAAFLALADHEEATDLQKSGVLAEGAACARLTGDYEEALALAARIPLEPIAKTARMENLSGQRSWDAIVEEFGGEDLRQWPFTEIGAAAAVRGRAFSAAEIGDKADADFQLALEFTSNTRSRTNILSAMARNRETVLQDDDLALETYRQIAASTTNTGSAEYFSGLQAAARILTKRKEFDDAIKILDQVDAEKLAGSWAPSMFLSRAETLAAAGRKDEALAAYRAVLKSESAHKAHQEKAEAAIADLSGR
ncbi:MAG: putative negative regulator of RcsB-dependent stress response [Verrucomicrobiales bacterium]